MDLKQIAKDTAKTLISYLTYQAMRTVLAQLGETDPPRAFWLQQFSARQNLQDGEAYLRALLAERPDLAYRIMTVREHIAAEVVDYLPEMAKTGIQQANMEHRREHLERMTSAPESAPVSSTHPEAGSPAQDSIPETE
ncbi:RuBisCO chaperone RbcX [Thermostichus vulcanus]|uniref:RuBisCO chaperone RbcX n=1 Tax=Thermostichus vulcanus str. 'Rupite' TaxID=2813851 RepID=A0ABT0C717_THEVL|nr:chaperonin family protein RbcX [Thermostichus vulcanus]MCJ2541573.1 chaperonin family protein RbcX [Thermostichus vulcanus str. 'Rupite']